MRGHQGVFREKCLQSQNLRKKLDISKVAENGAANEALCGTGLTFQRVNDMMDKTD